MDGINYVLPGDSTVNMYIDTKKYYQTEDVNLAISGSLSSVEMIKELLIILCPLKCPATGLTGIQP